MLLILLSSSLLAPLQAPPTVGGIERLQPREAGEILLKGREHGVIESIAPPTIRSAGPPGLVELELTERPVAVAGGCVRKRWTATFQRQPGADRGAATFADSWARTEVAIAPAKTCPGGRFVHVHPGMTSAQALGALDRLGRIRTGKAKVTFTCSDDTGSSLCRSLAAIRPGLARLSPWAVMRREGRIELWLGEPGQIVTAVSYPEGRPHRVTVKRSILAPF